MTMILPPIAAAYVRSVNDHDAAAFHGLFADDATVDDAGRTIQGLAAIEAWSDHDIFAANVTLEVVKVAEQNGETVVTTKVDGDFDRTGLPEPLIMRQHLKTRGGKIVSLACRLAVDGTVPS